MNHETVRLGKEKKLIGISVRTNNANELNQKTGKIYPTMMKFYNGGILEQTEKIDCRVDSNLVYCVYTDYASDMNGDYTYFIGQEVSSLDSVPDGLTTCTIPAQDYEKFISDLGQAPDIIINVWKKIWNANLNRTYKADFEVYNRSYYYENQKLYNKELYSADVYIGV